MDGDGDDFPDEETWFINPFEMNPLDGDQLYMITYDRVWRSTNKGDNWQHLTNVISPGNSNPYCLGISNDVNPTLYIGGENRLFWRVENALTASAGDEVSLISQVPVELADDFMSCITVHPNDPTKLLVSFSDYTTEPRIWSVTNAHTASPDWQDITGDLPAELPVNWVEMDPQNPDNYYIIATDFGIYTTSNGGTNWVLEGELPNVSVHQMRLRTSDRNLFIYTHGRGIWVAGLPGAILASTRENGPIKQTGMTIHPNPAREFTTITFDFLDRNSAFEFYVSDIEGKVFFQSKTIDSPNFHLNMAAWPKGMYIVHCAQGDSYFNDKLIRI